MFDSDDIVRESRLTARKLSFLPFLAFLFWEFFLQIGP